MDTRVQFRDAILSSGLEPPTIIEARPNPPIPGQACHRFQSKAATPMVVAGLSYTDVTTRDNTRLS
jgi:hypothetical protein